jgi:hypothetical protein
MKHKKRHKKKKELPTEELEDEEPDKYQEVILEQNIEAGINITCSLHNEKNEQLI